MKKNNNLPSVCIVGRPNVGKSSLFNYFIGQRRAVVVEESGTTRDRAEMVVSVGGTKVKLVDTGGYLSDDKDELSSKVKEQIYDAMEEASIILLVTDAIAGISHADEEIASILRKVSKPIILVVNKTDNDKLKYDAAEFYRLGFGDVEEISCVHRRGIRGLNKRLEEAVKLLDKDVAEGLENTEEHPGCIKIAIVGRPNVGKSSFINNLLKRNRVIVSDIPGTTRDSIDTYFNYGGDDYILIDTAGIRHKRKIKNVVDIFSIMRSKESIERADVVILLLDAAEGVTRDDVGILDFVYKSGKACLIAVNKWDLATGVEDVSTEDYKESLFEESPQLKKFPLIFISAKTGKKMIDTLGVVKDLNLNLDIEIPTPFLNSIFAKNNPSELSIPKRKNKPNFMYIVQSHKRPVEFKYFVNDPRRVLPMHFQFIENRIRQNISLLGIPIKILLRRSREERGKK